MLKHETWLDNQHGNKGALRWSGPFVIHERLNDHQYRLREIDGTVRREKVSRHRLNIFYFRDDRQTLQTTSADKEQYSSYPISRHTLADDVSTLPFNGCLCWMPIVVFGYGTEVDEYQHARLGDLDNIWGNAGDCQLLDPTYTMPLSLLNATRRSHNIRSLIRLSDDYLASPSRFLY